MANRQTNFFALKNVNLQCTCCGAWMCTMAEAAHHTLTCADRRAPHSSKTPGIKRLKRLKSLPSLNEKPSGLVVQLQENKSAADLQREENQKQLPVLPSSLSSVSNGDTSIKQEPFKFPCSVAQSISCASPITNSIINSPPISLPLNETGRSHGLMTHRSSISGEKIQGSEEQSMDKSCNGLSWEQSFTSNASGSPINSSGLAINTSNLSVQVTSAEDHHEQAIQCWDYFDENSLPSVVINFTERSKKPSARVIKSGTSDTRPENINDDGILQMNDQTCEGKNFLSKNYVKVEPTFRSDNNFQSASCEAARETASLVQELRRSPSSSVHHDAFSVYTSAHEELQDPLVSVHLEISDADQQVLGQDSNADQPLESRQRRTRNKTWCQRSRRHQIRSRRHKQDTRTCGVKARRVCHSCKSMSDFPEKYMTQNYEVGRRIESKLDELVDISKRREALELSLYQQSNESLQRLKRLERIFEALLGTAHQ